RVPQNASQRPNPATAGATVTQVAGGVSITVPLTIDVRLGIGVGGQTDGSAGAAAVGKVNQQGAMTLIDAVEALKSQLTGNDVISVREGFVFKDGWITKQPAIVVRVRPSSSSTLASLGLAEGFAGYPVELRDADPTEIAGAELGMGDTEAPH